MKFGCLAKEEQLFQNLKILGIHVTLYDFSIRRWNQILKENYLCIIMLNKFEKKNPYVYTLIVHRVYVSNYYTIFHHVFHYFSCEMLKYLPGIKVRVSITLNFT